MMDENILHGTGKGIGSTGGGITLQIEKKAETSGENDVIEMAEEVATVKKKLRQGKHTCLVLRMEHLRAYKIC